MRALVLLIACSGCVSERVVAPPATPLPIAPRTVQGVGNVVFDVTGTRKATVSAIRGIEDELELCTTPCAVTLKPGSYSVRFTDVTDAHLTSTAAIVVPPSGKILVRHSVGYQRRMPSAIGLAGITLGGAGLVTGFVGLVSAVQTKPSTQAGSIDLGIWMTMFAIGTLAFGGATLLLHFNRSERQDGATSITPL